jgi:hypothetical protein
MKDQITITISSSKEVDVAFASIGLNVGSRTGLHELKMTWSGMSFVGF